jgi:uncharacterized membrane protein YoaK (UPF0700 family)
MPVFLRVALLFLAGAVVSALIAQADVSLATWCEVFFWLFIVAFVMALLWSLYEGCGKPPPFRF